MRTKICLAKVRQGTTNQ